MYKTGFAHALDGRPAPKRNRIAAANAGWNPKCPFRETSRPGRLTVAVIRLVMRSLLNWLDSGL
jgi:hypothetical protein